MSDLIISCSGLKKTYLEAEIEVEVLKGIDLSVTPGENLAIIGASGSGKSTLLHLLGGLERPTSGEVFVTGKLMSGLSEEDQGLLRNRTLGFVYQFHHLLTEFTALENVAMPLLIRGMAETDAMQEAGKVLGNVGLGQRLKHKPGELSGGERQRTAIARALVTRPACILADEPTGNLDEHTAEQVFKIMLDLNREHSVSLIMVTHNMDLIRHFDTVKVIHDGRLEDYTP